MPIAHPIFWDAQREALITETWSSACVLKCAQTHFIQGVQITLVQIFSI